MGKYGGFKPYTEVSMTVCQTMPGLLTFSSKAAVIHTINYGIDQ